MCLCVVLSTVCPRFDHPKQESGVGRQYCSFNALFYLWERFHRDCSLRQKSRWNRSHILNRTVLGREEARLNERDVRFRL